VKEIPHFQKTYERLKDKNLIVLGIAVPQGDTGTKPDVLSFMEDKGMTYPNVMHDNVPMEALQNSYGAIRGLPTTYVLDGQGELVQSFVGYTSEEKLKNAVEPLVEAQE
jgi:thiol-disulfide isomerase/thioredoxin